MSLCNRLAMCGLLTMTSLLSGCASGTGAAALPEAVPLWNGVAPGSEGQTTPEKYSIQHVPATANNPEISFGIVTNVNNPSITPFLPAREKATGVAVIVAPGGGHQMLAIDHEGYDVGRWLADHGVAGFVLKYRLARAPGSPYKIEVHELMDAQARFDWCEAGPGIGASIRTRWESWDFRPGESLPSSRRHDSIGRLPAQVNTPPP